MKLQLVLEEVRSLDKGPFLNHIEFLSKMSTNVKVKETDKNELKKSDSEVVVNHFLDSKDAHKALLNKNLFEVDSQLDILIDILTRDGNAIMSKDWFSRLYEKEVKKLRLKVKNFVESLKDPKTEKNKRHAIYTECLKTAYLNDKEDNRDPKIDTKEQSILNTLSDQLGLDFDDIKLSKYSVLGIKFDLDKAIASLRSIGAILYSSKDNIIYVPDEIVAILQKVYGKVVADKYFRRILKTLSEPQINRICKIKEISTNQSIDSKIRAIISSGINFKDSLEKHIFKQDEPQNKRKLFINNLCDKNLGITPRLMGTTLSTKLDNLILYFDKLFLDDNLGIAREGYEKLIHDLDRFECKPSLVETLKFNFEFQEGENITSPQYLLYQNIKPRDILELFPDDTLQKFCEEHSFKKRGNTVMNILEGYKDTADLLLENYKYIGLRDLRTLSEAGISLKESELGIQFEELTKRLFSGLNLNIDEPLRKSINSAKDKADILINIGNNEVILVECKTVKERGYNHYSSISRQLKAYVSRIQSKGYKVAKTLVVAPDFTPSFIADCDEHFVDLDVSVLKADHLYQIYSAFKGSKRNNFPPHVLFRGVVVEPDSIISRM